MICAALVLVHLQTGWRVALLLLAATPLVYYLAATLVAWRFFRNERGRTLPDYAPPVSLLKPVHGAGFGSYENFSSFCRQDYPNYEILFAVNDEYDPAGPLIERLMNEFPQRQIRLLIGAECLGANRKVSKLVRLAAEARHEILAVTDGDVRVGLNYLREVVAPFQEAQTGLVTSLYRGIAQPNLGAQLEAIGASSDFFAGVLMARWTEGMSFALGASMVTTKKWLAKVGGFKTLADMHSDDYQLGHHIAKAGGRVLLSREPVWTMYPAQTARGFWDHQVRWARTVRHCRPFSYLGLLFTHGLPWAIVGALLAPTTSLAASFLLTYVVLRFTMAWTVGVWGIGDDVLRRRFFLLPLRDAIHFAVWLASFTSNRIIWGGEPFLVRKAQLVPVAAAASPHGGAATDTSRLR